MNQNGRFSQVFNILFCAFMLAPIVVVMGVSLTPEGFLEFPPSGISLRWYQAILDNPDFIEAAWISLKLGIVAAILH